LTRERPLLDRVLADVGGRLDARLWRQNAGTARSFDGSRIIQLAPAGASDATGLIATPCHCGCGRVYGLHLAIETKGKHGRQTPEQRRFQRMVEQLGGVYILARSIEDLNEQLKSRGYVGGNEPGARPEDRRGPRSARPRMGADPAEREDADARRVAEAASADPRPGSRVGP
jgi:hypothetical protein